MKHIPIQNSEISQMHSQCHSPLQISGGPLGCKGALGCFRHGVSFGVAHWPIQNKFIEIAACDSLKTLRMSLPSGFDMRLFWLVSRVLNLT